MLIVFSSNLATNDDDLSYYKSTDYLKKAADKRMEQKKKLEEKKQKKNQNPILEMFLGEFKETGAEIRKTSKTLREFLEQGLANKDK